MRRAKRLVICFSIVCLASGHRAAPASEPAPFPDDWLQDKDVVSAQYVRDRWQELETLRPALKGFDCAGFVTAPGENGGRTRNFVGCVFRVSLVTPEKIRDFHTRMTSLGFHLEQAEPKVWAYKVSPAVKAKADELVSEARRRIGNRLPHLVRGLQQSPTKDGTDTYHYPKHGFLCVAFDDFSAKMSYKELSCGCSMAIHLPSLGYLIQVFGAKEQEQAVVSGFAPEEVLQLVKTEVSGLVRLDPRAKITGPSGETQQPAAADALPRAAER